MIRVLRLKNSVFPIDVVCQTCGALLEVGSATDLKIACPNGKKIPQFSCPNCGRTMALEEKDREKAIEEHEKCL
jgi:predicted RNA-binding Zn-ribbon protein involved in translation (DUF1610 family)